MNTNPTLPELLPCPFCGSDDLVTKNEYYAIECLQCCGEGPLGRGDAEARERWNRRVPVDKETKP